jgi:hypothetical protein
MKTFSSPSAAIADDLRFLRYRREVISQMPEGREREERLNSIEIRMLRLEQEALLHAA